MNGKSVNMMKYGLYTVVLTTFMLSCSEDESLDGIQPAPKKVLMEFYAGADAATRTQLVEGNAVYWEAGDPISLFDPSGSNNEFSTAESGASVHFTGMAIESIGTYYALYPYDGEAQISGSVITTTLPARQAALGGSFSRGLNPSVATADAKNNLFFKNACALVKFTLDATSPVVAKATLQGNNGEELAGELSIDANEADLEAVVDSGWGDTVVELVGTLTPGNTYYFVVAPGTLNDGLTLTLYDSDGKVWTKQGSQMVKLLPSYILDLGTVTPDNFVPSVGYEVDVNGVYHIYNADGLMEWASLTDVLAKGVVLENDIDLSGKTWMPVGANISDGTGYAGDFDGNGKFIYNLSIDSDAGNVGFFGGLAQGAKVHDVKFSNATVTGGNTSYAGVVAGASLGIIEDCNVRSSEVSGQYVGAVVGNNSVQVNRCNALDVTIHADVPGGMVGGIAGISYGKIEYSTVSGSSFITANGSSGRAGGIAGYTSEENSISTSGRLLKCAVDGATISGTWAGGIAGENSFGIVAQCVANGVTVTHQSSDASTRLGGVVGYNTRGDVVASYSAYSTIGTGGLISEAMGGIVGYNNNTTADVYGCYSTHVSFQGGVSGDEAGTGSIVGYTNGHVTSCYAVLPDGSSGVHLIGNGATSDHCVEAGSTNYQTLITGVGNLTADDGSVWEAAQIWNLTASGAPTIVSTYICNPPVIQP